MRGEPASALQRHRALRRRSALAQACEEQALVDAALEDRDPQLHALREDFLASQSGLAGKLGGRQMVGHRHLLGWGGGRERTTCTYSATGGCWQPWICRGAASHGVGDVHEHMTYPKALAQALPQALHPERLGCVVA